MKVVQLGPIRDLTDEWEKVRQHFVSGKVTGFSITLRDDQGREAIYMAGHYKRSPKDAARVAMRMSAARVMAEDDPLPLTGTQ
jgi:hypothetical protein